MRFAIPTALRRRTVVVGLAACGLTLLAPRGVRAQSARDQATNPTYGVRIYEVFQQGPTVRLLERLGRPFGPHLLRDVPLETTVPPESEPALRIYRSRDHL